MSSEVVMEMVGLIPGLTALPSAGPGGAGHTYILRGKQIGTVRSMNRKSWRIDSDALGYPFGSEREATLELFQRISATMASVTPREQRKR